MALALDEEGSPGIWALAAMSSAPRRLGRILALLDEGIAPRRPSGTA
jgi:hypothetical protein